MVSETEPTFVHAETLPAQVPAGPNDYVVMKSGTDTGARRCTSVSGPAGRQPRLRLVPPPEPEPGTSLSVPNEVSDAISVAWRACETLQTSGQRLHFTVDRADGTFAAVLQDLHGNPLDTLSVDQVLRLAGGGSTS